MGGVRKCDSHPAASCVRDAGGFLLVLRLLEAREKVAEVCPKP